MCIRDSDSIEDVKRSLLVALIDRKVNKYFTEIDALVRKIENDKYFVVFKNQYLGKLREDRFSIIEDVKTVNVGNEMAVTLSIGIGVGGDSYTKNYEYARMAIDLALGRGGDQVVVRDNEDVTYYGGKTNKQVAVSYTHLDVYKRQDAWDAASASSERLPSVIGVSVMP